MAKACRVPISAACTRAGMAASTPHRWENGSEPSEDKLKQLRAGVLVEASERGTLPPEYKRELTAAQRLLDDGQPEAARVDDPHEIVNGIEKDLRRLRRAMRSSGVQAATS